MHDTFYGTPLDLAIKALRSLKPGETYVYYTGFLDGERLLNPRGDYNRIADLAYDLMQEGKIHLTQRRVGPPIIKGAIIDWKSGISGMGFEYIATGALPRKSRKQPIVIYPFRKLVQ